MNITRKFKDNYYIIYLRNHPLEASGFIIVIISLFFAFFGPAIAPNPTEIGVSGAQLLPPSSQYWFGTDENGMCIFSRTIAAYRVDLVIVLTGALGSMIIGAPLGVYIGFFDGKKGAAGLISRITLRIIDVVQAFPIMVLGLLMVAAFGPNYLNLIVLIIIANLPANLRLARTEVLSLREKQFVEAARASGNSETKIAFKHLMLNAMNPILNLFSVVVGFGILLIAGLSFVGAGVRPPTPEWGSMIAIGASQMITGQWWPSVFPGLFMAITVFGFSMVGKAVTALLDPLERVTLGIGR